MVENLCEWLMAVKGYVLVSVSWSVYGLMIDIEAERAVCAADDVDIEYSNLILVVHITSNTFKMP